MRYFEKDMGVSFRWVTFVLANVFTLAVEAEVNDKDGFKPVTSPSFTYPPTTVIPAGQCPIAKECDSDGCVGWAAALVSIVVFVALVVFRVLYDYSKGQTWGQLRRNSYDPGMVAEPTMKLPTIVTRKIDNNDLSLQEAFLQGKFNEIRVGSFILNHEVLKKHCHEIEPSALLIGNSIARDQFGNVCTATYTELNSTKTVLVKTFCTEDADSSSGCGSRDLINDIKLTFFKEAFVMCQLQHQNIISLVGIISSPQAAIIMEYAQDGPLDAFLKKNEGVFNIFRLQTFMQQIASGMNYLSATGYVHRCLAAKNVLVSSNLVCKISKFKVPTDRQIQNELEDYAAWTAPEVYLLNKHTKMSDVWSFGVVCWEIFSEGSQPYANWSSQTTIEYVRKGYRMKVPFKCPKSIGNMIMDCWEEDFNARPSFAALSPALSEHCDRLAIAVETHKVFEWLFDLGLSRFAPNFLRCGIISKQLLETITMDDLARMEIPVDDQDTIMKGIRKIRDLGPSSRYQFAV